ncbi:Dph6-related ATP pyrophosphatase [Fulvivirga lutea]|uniref:Diphthine--ammonia ligase n=1 Tax=Fulvivirga lutea TaxID=2810512 RepID=A0A974WFN8_9BACT|nr:diphthine--ammonia ligase [Fulvivirga lutea]QSE97603.1 diphthine--ammonia ligase [Fulvivirga lutea]
MGKKPKIHISWSGGKDSALALHKIQQSDKYEIVGLHTVIEEDSGRVGIHNIKEEFIAAQAEELGLPLTKLYLKKKPMAYDKLMVEYYQSLKAEGIDYVMFGDIFLEDLKDFRESLMRKSGMRGLYPLWKKDSEKLIYEFLSEGFKTKLCAVDAKFIDAQWVGKALDSAFIMEHSNIDPCGENGEYHSFVVDGPIFKNQIPLKVTDKYEHDFTFKVKNKKGEEEVINDKFYFAEFELS